MKNDALSEIDPKDEDLELQKQIERELAEYKLDDEDDQYNKSLRDDMSEYGNYLINNGKNIEESMEFDNDPLAQLRLANQALNKEHERIEEKIKDMKDALNYNFYDVNYEDENLQKTKIEIKNELIPKEKDQQIKDMIREKLNKNIDEPKFEDGILIGKINLEERDKEIENKIVKEVIAENIRFSSTGKQETKIENKSSKQREIDLRLERAKEEREIMNMEKEDIKSMKYEENFHKNKFSKRLFNLPDNFPMNKDPSSATSDSALKFWIPRLNVVKLDKPIEKPADNLIESSKAKLESKELNKISNKKRLHVKFQKIGQKEQKLLQDKSKMLTINSSSQPNLQEAKKRSTPKVRDAKIMNKEISHLTPLFLKKIEKQTNEIFKFIFSPKILEGLTAILSLNENLKSSKSYNFYSKGEDEAENQKLLIADDNPNKNIKSVLELMDTDDLLAHTKLEIKMEKIQDLKGVEELKNLRFLYLSMNNIKDLSNLVDVKQLVEINLAQNEIKSMKGIQNLKNLRLLNLEVNQLTKIEGLSGCPNLEYLDLNNNQITTIENLVELKKLKILLLFRNKITKISGLDNLIALEELDIGRNIITGIEGISNCIGLRKLVLYYNQISKIPNNFSHMFLVEMWLNGNLITDISNFIYFPSLEVLNLQENKLDTIFKDSCPFFPMLRKLNLNNNKLFSFAQIHKLLKKSPLLEELFCVENPFLTDITESTFSFYQESFSETLPFLRELNNKKFNSVKGYREYSQRKKTDDLEYFSPFLRYLDDYYYIDKVASSKFNPSRASFGFQKNLAICKIINGPVSLIRIRDLMAQRLANPIILKHDYTFELSRTEIKYKLSLIKVKSFLLKVIYKRRKIKKHYQNNMTKIVKIQSFTRGMLTRKIHDARKSLKKKKERENFLRLSPFAIKIQKVFRGFRTRLRKKRFFNNIKLDDDDLDFEDDALRFFDQDPDVDKYNLKIPENFDLGQFIPARQPLRSNLNEVYNKPNYPASLSNHQQTFKNHELSPIKNVIEEKKDEEFDNDDAYSVSSAKTGKSIDEIRFKKIPIPPNKKPVITSEEKDKITEDWGFKDKNSAIFLRIQKERMQKEAKNKKATTAEDRIAAFRANNLVKKGK